MISDGLESLDGRTVLRDRADEWEDLLARGGAGTFFLRAAWLRAWERHFLAGRDFRCLILVRDGAWAAALPLVRSRGRLGRWPVRKLEFAGAPLFDFVEAPAVDDDSRVELMRAAVRWFRTEARDCSVFDLRELDVTGPTLAATRTAAQELDVPCHVRLCSRAPLLDLDAFARTGIRSGNLRSQLRRTDKRLQERGRLESTFGAPAPDALESLLLGCAAIEELSWKGRAGVGVLRDGAPRAWAMDLFRSCAAAGTLLMATLRLDGRLIAYHWGFRDGARFLSYNQAQAPDLADLGPGTLLLQRMIEAGAAMGLRALDASRGSLERPHILARYHGAVREHQQALIYQSNWRGGALRVARHAVLPALRGLRRRGAADAAPGDGA